MHGKGRRPSPVHTAATPLAAAWSGARADAAITKQPVAQRGVDAVLARYNAHELAFLASAPDSWWSENQNQKQDPSLQALDAVLAEYGV